MREGQAVIERIFGNFIILFEIFLAECKRAKTESKKIKNLESKFLNLHIFEILKLNFLDLRNYNYEIPGFLKFRI